MTQCRKVPDRECQVDQKTVCVERPETQCEDIHKKVPHTLRRKKPVQVCSDDPENGDDKYVFDV